MFHKFHDWNHEDFWDGWDMIDGSPTREVLLEESAVSCLHSKSIIIRYTLHVWFYEGVSSLSALFNPVVHGSTWAIFCLCLVSFTSQEDVNFTIDIYANVSKI